MVSITHLSHQGVRYIREHPQLLATILLMVVIPIAFLVSGQQFLNAARFNQERLEMDRVGMMHDLFAAYMQATNFDTEQIQNEILELANQNPDIKKFHIAREEGTSVRIVASLQSEQVGELTSNPDTYRIGNTNPNEAIISPYVHGGIRYWQSFRLIRDDIAPDHYIFIETSLEHIDSLFASRIMSAYYWLIVLLGIIFILLIRHVRLIDYAYLYRETKKANEMKDLFTNMIAHELRAPLTAMRGYASMIRERAGVDEESKRNATEIESAAGRLVTIVSDLLDVARIQSGGLSMEKATVHLSGLTRSVIEAQYPSARAKGIELIVDDPSGNLSVQNDEKRLYQVLTNVLSNAIKYTPKGTITVSLMRMSDRIEVRVKDTGMGISSDNQKKLFAPFFRVGGKEMSTITGTGLGMWITKQLVELMSGSIGVESIKGVGTHVVITFPQTDIESGGKS